MGLDVEVRGVRVEYNGREVLHGVDLRAEAGESLVILGPSGSGKSTLLKVVAGLVPVKSGHVVIGGRDVTKLPPEKRGVAMLFQDLALFPHMNVFENVAFGLRVRRLPEREVRELVRWALELVRLDPEEVMYRRVHELSGGQQQRVALARALVINPEVLLLDEPFSHVDYQIKMELIRELRRLRDKLGFTSIYVTHDRFEAVELGDKIAVMRDGKILQVGKPIEIYRKPVNRFVAEFFGEANIVDPREAGLNRDGDKIAIIRPEVIKLGGGVVKKKGRVIRTTFLWQLIRLEVDDGERTYVIYVDPSRDVRIGDEVVFGWDPDDIVITNKGG